MKQTNHQESEQDRGAKPAPQKTERFLTPHADYAAKKRQWCSNGSGPEPKTQKSCVLISCENQRKKRIPKWAASRGGGGTRKVISVSYFLSLYYTITDVPRHINNHANEPHHSKHLDRTPQGKNGHILLTQVQNNTCRGSRVHPGVGINRTDRPWVCNGVLHSLLHKHQSALWVICTCNH